MSVDVTPEAAEPVRTLDDLVGYFESARKPVADWRVGLEHEKVAVLADSVAPVPYEGPRGIREFLLRARRLGYELVFDLENPIAGVRAEQWLSLEPGGQVEISGRPAKTAIEVADEHLRATGRLRALGAELGVRFLGVGYRPFGRVEQMPQMPKRRYAMMREALEPRAPAAAMMAMTGSVQASFDFSDEEDCSRKVRAAASVASIATALFANSPIVDGALTGVQSYRARLWRDFDVARSGLPAFLFDDEGFRFRRYAEWAMQAPMIFIRRRGQYLPMRGVSFARFFAEGYRGERATLVDWSDHLTLVFPDVRVKKVIELRSADACNLEVSNALPALGLGLLYDDDARDAAIALTAALDMGERNELQALAARDGLRARVPGSGWELRDLAVELVAMAANGLRRQGRADEVQLLAPLAAIAESGRSEADRLIEAWRARDTGRLLAACAIDGAFEHDVKPRV